jgi:hypothetical protein
MIPIITNAKTPIMMKAPLSQEYKEKNSLFILFSLSSQK